MPFDAGAMKKRFQAAGNRFTFFLAVEYYKPQICEAIAKGMKDITPEKFRRMVEKGEFFPIPPSLMAELAGWKQHVKYVKPQLVGEIFAGARPDLYKILEEKDAVGGAWLIMLHRHLSQLVLSAQDAPPPAEAQEEMCVAECGACHQKWPVKKSEVAAIKECPFCHKDPSQTETQAPPGETEST